jgi:hypothetical protein
MLGIQPLQSEIEKRKSSFFGKLSNMETDLLPKQAFTARLFEYLSNSQNTKFGYIKDISLIIQKYSLQNFMDTYIRTGNFPRKNIWKNLSIPITVQNGEKKINTDSDFTDFKYLQSATNLALLWTHQFPLQK